MGPHEYRFINLFRALAAFWVLAAHCMIWGGWYGVPLPSPKYAVDLFMLVSGFLMVANAVGRQDRESLADPSGRARFWTRRFFRIAPAYYLALLIALLGSDLFLAGKTELQVMQGWNTYTYSADRVDLSLTSVLMHLSFLFGASPHHTASTGLPDWSIGLEMQFYFAFPLLFMLMRRPFVLVAATVAVFVCGLGVRWLVWYPEPSLLAFKLQFFVAGMLLFQMLREPNLPRRIGMMACALILVSLEDRRDWQTGGALLLAMYALALLEQAGQTPRAIANTINSRVVRFASDVSYSVYLFQGLCIGTFGLWAATLPPMTDAQRTLALFLFTVPTAYGMGWLIYRYIELPGIRGGKRLLAYRSKRNVGSVEVDVELAGGTAASRVDNAEAIDHRAGRQAAG